MGLDVGCVGIWCSRGGAGGLGAAAGGAALARTAMVEPGRWSGLGPYASPCLAAPPVGIFAPSTSRWPPSSGPIAAVAWPAMSVSVQI